MARRPISPRMLVEAHQQGCSSRLQSLAAGT